MVYLFGKQSFREGKKIAIFPLAASLPNGHIDNSWKPGAKNPTYMEGRSKVLESCAAVFAAPVAGSWIRREVAWTEGSDGIECWHSRWWFNPLHPSADFKLFLRMHQRNVFFSPVSN